MEHRMRKGWSYQTDVDRRMQKGWSSLEGGERRKQGGDVAEMVHDHSKEGGGSLAILFKQPTNKRDKRELDQKAISEMNSWSDSF